MDLAEREALVAAFKAIAAPYEIPTSIVEGWALSQALDFQRWPKRQVGFAKPVNWKDYYGPLTLDNKIFYRTKPEAKRHRPTKRERDHARRVTP